MRADAWRGRSGCRGQREWTAGRAPNTGANTLGLAVRAQHSALGTRCGTSTCSQRHRRTVEAAFGEEGAQRGGGGVERGVLLAVRLHRRGRNATRVPKKNLEIEHSRTLHPTPRATCLLLLNSTHDAPGLVQVALLRPDGRLVTARPKVRLVVACVIIGKHKTKVSRTASAHLPPWLLFLRQRVVPV